MATFVMKGRYSVDAIKAISTARTKQAQKIVDQCGGTIHAVYATMGDTDLLVIVDFPGVAEAVKASITLTKALGITFSSVPALGVEEFDKLTAGKR